MRFAIPLHDGKLTMHFGHCEKFAIIDADTTTQTITAQGQKIPPAHEPGVLPKWLAEEGVNVIIAGGIGQRAQQLFAMNGIKVLFGAAADTPENLVKAYMAGNLSTGSNVCDH
ncbi:MAG: NifB/NifX family molybdenum-iron cluster-binding protein [Phycisphaerae bacterium]